MKVYAINPTNTNNLNGNLQKKAPFFYPNFRGGDLLELSKADVFERIKASLIPENFVGQGSEAQVYKINNTEYCVRIPHKAIKVYGLDYKKELTPVDKVNHIVAKLGFGAAIMKYLPGQTPKEHRDNSFYRYKFQERISEMPVNSYTNLLHQIADGINNNMYYDCAGGNLIVNFDKQTLTPIDFCQIDMFANNATNPLSKMYHILTCYGSEKNTGKKIFDKIMLTGLKEFEPGTKPCMDVELFDFKDLCIDRINDNFGKNEKFFSDEFFELFENLKKLKKSEMINKSLSNVLSVNLDFIRKTIKRIN